MLETFKQKFKDRLHSLKYEKKTAIAYGIVFGKLRAGLTGKVMDSDQRRVLADLSTFCEAGLSNHSDDPNALSRHTGRIEVYNHIIRNIDYREFIFLESEIKKTQEEINDVGE